MATSMHQLEPGDNGRVRCTICRWSWGGKGSIKAACPGVPRYGSYKDLPAYLKTATMLKRAGLKTTQEPAGCVYIAGRRTWVWLYDERQAVTRRKASPAQLAALARGRATALAHITCTLCGHVAEGRKEQRQIRRDHLCVDCIEERYWRQDHNAAIHQARSLVEQEIVVLDTETTGLEPKDTVIELALLNVSGEVLLHTLLRPAGPISSTAQAVHGLTAADLEQAPSFANVWPRLHALLTQYPLVSYNSAFDLRLLWQTAHQAGVVLPDGWDSSAICLMELYAAYRGEVYADGEYRSLSLGEACRAEGVPPGSHRAVEDAQAALALLKALARKEPLPEPEGIAQGGRSA
jgi:DNA polymerase-3 subunit epsilon